MRGVIVVGNNLSPTFAKRECDGAFVVGADKGALYCCKNRIKMDLAVGDFDSLSEEEKRNVLAFADKSVALNPIKDDTDTAHALSLLSGCEEVAILGGIQGKRIEHFLAILDLLAKDQRVCLKDDNSLIKTFLPGDYIIKKDEYRFFSFFALEDAVITLEGFHYSLSGFLLKRYDPLGISNQIKNEEGRLSLKSGRLLMVCSKDDS